VEQDKPIRLRTDLVTVTATVTDRAGRAIKGLTADDFDVYEEGVKQKIAHFAPTEEPFTVMLLLDLSGSTLEDIKLIKRAAKAFLAALGSDDRVGVIAFSAEVELIADFTDSRANVDAAIDALATAQAEGGHRFSFKTGTSFYDALFLAVDESPLKGAGGRKAIVCLSDGVDSTSLMKFPEVAKAVERSEAAVYFLAFDTEQITLARLLKPQSDPGYVNFSQSQIDRYFDEYAPESLDRTRHRRTLPPTLIKEINKGLYEMARRHQSTLAERTGGRVYKVTALTDLSSVFQQVAGDLRSLYSIGYYPENQRRDGRWRAIRVEVRGGAQVRARPGYWADRTNDY
jgi:Ca-activated chloride channel family protein